MSQRSGTIALVGRPNAGKSSLLNLLVGEPIAAVSRRAQTTRNRVLGVCAADLPDGTALQAVLLDTPGLHDAWTGFNRTMIEVTEKALEEVDAVAWIVDVTEPVAAVKVGNAPLDPGLMAVQAKLAGRPHCVVLNKIDLVEDKRWLLPVIAAFDAVGGGAVLPVSARSGLGRDALLAAWAKLLPEGEPLFPADQITDAPEKFIVAEMIRERVFENADQEVPYATAVEVERFDESQRELGRVHIHARIIVEKDSQKGILIGAGGQMIKKIGTQARKRIEALLGCKVRLDLFVAVEKDWTRNPRLLRELGYGAAPPKPPR